MKKGDTVYIIPRGEYGLVECFINGKFKVTLSCGLTFGFLPEELTIG